MFEPGPVYLRGSFVLTESVMSAKVTPRILSSDISVQAQVSTVFEIEQ